MSEYTLKIASGPFSFSRCLTSLMTRTIGGLSPLMVAMLASIRGGAKGDGGWSIRVPKPLSALHLYMRYPRGEPKQKTRYLARLRPICGPPGKSSTPGSRGVSHLSGVVPKGLARSVEDMPRWITRDLLRDPVR